MMSGEVLVVAVADSVGLAPTVSLGAPCRPLDVRYAAQCVRQRANQI